MTFRVAWLGPLAVLMLFSCSPARVSDGLCRISSDLRGYEGRALVINDAILVDGHGDSFFVPDKSCKKFHYFDARLDELPPNDKAALTRALRQLNETKINGHCAGLGGNYEVRVQGEGSDPPTLVIQAFRGVRIMAVAEKQESLDAQLSPSGR